LSEQASGFDIFNMLANGGDHEAGRAREFVQGLERGLKVIQSLAAETDGRTIAQAARDTGLTRAVARRYLLTLRSLGYAVQVGDRFRATPRFLGLGITGRPAIEVGTHIDSVLEETHRALGDRGSVAATLLDGAETSIVAAKGEGGLRLETGLRRPAATTAAGLVLLGSVRPEEWTNQNLRPAQELLPSPSHLALLTRVESVRTAGFAEQLGHAASGRLELAVPVLAGNRTILAALEVSLPCDSSDTEIAAERETALTVLRAAAARLSTSVSS
jgi:IclR family pca regulon transcriptional regulator